MTIYHVTPRGPSPAYGETGRPWLATILGIFDPVGAGPEPTITVAIHYDLAFGG